LAQPGFGAADAGFSSAGAAEVAAPDDAADTGRDGDDNDRGGDRERDAEVAGAVAITVLGFETHCRDGHWCPRRSLRRTKGDDIGAIPTMSVETPELLSRVRWVPLPSIVM